MKTIERNTNCRDTRREIEEAEPAEPLSSAVDGHLRACIRCETFYDQQSKLRQIVSGLGTVAAPNDFEFRLRARLATEKRGVAQPVSIGNLSFGFRSAAFATILLLIGSALLILNLRPSTNNSSIAGVTGTDANSSRQPQIGPAGSEPVVNAGVGGTPPLAVAANTNPSDAADRKLKSRVINGEQTRASQRRPRPTQVALASNGRTKIREMGSTAAKVVRPDDLVAAAGHSVFPIDASRQALKVSLDNGRGTSKTISVPGVSFGSQRVLTQNPSPLLAASRGAW